MASSMILVRATSHQPLRLVTGVLATIARPCSPARRSASGSRNNASARADSVARYSAVHLAVSETWVTKWPASDIRCVIALGRWWNRGWVVYKGLMDDPAVRSASPPMLREAMARRLYRRAVMTAQITVPAVPSMIDEYVKMCDNVFAASGVHYTAEQSAQLKSVLAAELLKAYSASSRSNIVISFHAPFGIGMNYRVTTESVTLGGAYDGWLDTREGPLFGTEPDARVWALAAETADAGKPSGTRRRRGNRSQCSGSGAARAPGRCGRDEPEVRRHHPGRGRARIPSGARSGRRRLRDHGRGPPRLSR